MTNSVLSKEHAFFLLRYLSAGGFSFVVNIGLLYLFERYLGWWYLLASTVAFMISVAVSFLMQKYVTFRDRAVDHVSRQAFTYIAIAIFNVIVNALNVFLLVEYGGMPVLLSQVISAGIIAVWSLVLYKRFVFSYDV